MKTTPLTALRPPGHRRDRGSVLVVGLVLAALGTIGVAAWFALLDARGHQVEASGAALERRFIHSNSRALASRALYAGHLHASAPPEGDALYALPHGLGRAVIRSYGAAPLIATTQGGPSRSGATPVESYAVEAEVDLHDGFSDHRWTFGLRSANPGLAGDILSLHPPVPADLSPPLVSGNLRVKGRAVFWDAVAQDLGTGLRAEEFLLPGDVGGTVPLLDIAGNAVLPLNYPHYLRTVGSVGHGPALAGELEVVRQAVNPPNAYEARIPGSGVTELSGTKAKSQSKGPKNKPKKFDDDEWIEFIETSSPEEVTEELSKHDSLSSEVLMAAVHKDNPPFSDAQLLQVFSAQKELPDDALTEIMASLNEAEQDPVLDTAYTEMNMKNGTQFNANGKGMVQIFLHRSELTHIRLENVRRLRLFGQPNENAGNQAAELPPLIIIVDNTGGQRLDRLELYHANKRAVVLAVMSDPASPHVVPVEFRGNTAFPGWRIFLDLQSTGLSVNASGTAAATLVGGIRGDGPVRVTSGSLTLEGDPKRADWGHILSRDVWIEARRN